MARKNLLKGLMEPLETKSASPAPPRAAKGAIGAVSQSIADLKSRSVIDLDPHLIDPGGVLDRLEYDEAEHARLVDSIREYGQQVPVLVRPNPEDPERYQIVYGRRRVLAMRDLDMPVKAMIRDLDDTALVMAQGQENTARKDLSFIEQANFARQMRDAGYKRKIICDALHIDKTVISRMFSIVDRIPVEAIHAIGAAPSVGRDRWMKMAEIMEEKEVTGSEAAVLCMGDTSDQRFEMLFKALTIAERRAAEARKPLPRPTRPLVADDGERIGTVRISEDKITLELVDENVEGFPEWLIQQLPGIHRRWKESGGE